MKKENKEKANEQNVGAVHTHTHTHTQHSLKDNNNRRGTVHRARGNDGTNKNNVGAPFGRPQITNIVLTIISIILAFALIIVVDNNNKNLDKIIYRAKKEAEQTLVSTGRVIYAEDVEDYIGAHSVRPLSNEELPENTIETPQGTVVLPKENWNIETVTAVSVGNGDTVPVPIGFYYVGGDLSTGVIISDNKEDEYDGETDKTTYEYTTQLKGNQFVWIPCKEEEYKKCEVWNEITQNSLNKTLCNSSWDKTTYTAELPQIRKYEGFYIGRYEAGLANTITEFTSTQQHINAENPNKIYNIDQVNGVATKPQSKAGEVPWNFIDWNHAQTNAKNMYNTVSVSSGLITGTQWDVMLNKMVEKGVIQASDLTSSGNWGNYMNNSIEYTGRMARAYKSGDYWYLTAFGGTTISKTAIYGSNNGDVLTTGASSQTEKYHVFDVAGNLFEWTDECSLYKANTTSETNAQHRVVRGGDYNLPFATVPVCYRAGHLVTGTDLAYGFRVALYLK